jgi:hypothetical protein
VIVPFQRLGRGQCLRRDLLSLTVVQPLRQRRTSSAVSRSIILMQYIRIAVPCTSYPAPPSSCGRFVVGYSPVCAAADKETYVRVVPYFSALHIRRTDDPPHTATPPWNQQRFSMREIALRGSVAV